MVYVEILAGGKGTRMGNTELPKQFLVIGNKPIVVHTIEQFMLNPKVDKILVCCPKQWMSYTEDLIEKYIPLQDKVVVVQGGATRNDTVLNGCKYIEENYGINDEDVILTHDAVRPFLTQRIITENIEGARLHMATDTVVEAFDTIVESVDGESISNIPVRDHMYQGQTPQSFNMKKMLEVYNSLTRDEMENSTDACKTFILKGEKVHLVKGEVYNMKITTQHDLQIANALVSLRKGN